MHRDIAPRGFMSLRERSTAVLQQPMALALPSLLISVQDFRVLSSILDKVVFAVKAELSPISFTSRENQCSTDDGQHVGDTVPGAALTLTLMVRPCDHNHLTSVYPATALNAAMGVPVPVQKFNKEIALPL